MFVLIRFIIGVLIAVLLYYFKKRMSGKANLGFFIITAGIIISLLGFIPLESPFISFDSPEASYSYFNPTATEAQCIIEGANSAIVVENDSDGNLCFVVPRDEDGWKVSLGINKIRLVFKSFKYGDNYGALYAYRAIGTNDYYLIIDNYSPGSLEISDSINSEFIPHEKYNPKDGATYITYYAVLPDVNEQYRLYINGSEYIVF